MCQKKGNRIWRRSSSGFPKVQSASLEFNSSGGRRSQIQIPRRVQYDVFAIWCFSKFPILKLCNLKVTCDTFNFKYSSFDLSNVCKNFFNDNSLNLFCCTRRDVWPLFRFVADSLCEWFGKPTVCTRALQHHEIYNPIRQNFTVLCSSTRPYPS